MGDISSACTFRRIVPALGLADYYELLIETPATADANDTIAFTAATYGAVKGGTAYNHTDDTVETLAIALSTGTYTITCGTGTDKARTYRLLMKH